MPKPNRFTRLHAQQWLVAVLFAGACIAPPLRAAQAGSSSSEQTTAKQKLADIRSKMAALATQQAATAVRRTSANAELARQASALAVAARAVHESDLALAAKQQQLLDLQQQSAALTKNLDHQHAAIAELLRATYALGQGSDLRLLLGDEDMARIARALVYSKYFQQDRMQRVQRLMGDLARLQQLQSTINSEQLALQATRATREQQAATLAQRRATQRKFAAATDAQYQDQAQRLAALKQDAESLDHLVEQLQRAIDAAAREAAAREAAARAAAVRKHPGQKAPPPIEVGNASANIRGNLPWPASGVVKSYGAGVLIKASGGSEIHAVARGKVIYAGFLRGYGMLLIVNHGNGWMSMYGNNETLLHGVGDEVEAGTAIGTASPPTGVNTGVYFELRNGGQPVDPRSWLSQRR
jgi:septal ring factor EnvC (AmiA/AmiB activator)